MTNVVNATALRSGGALSILSQFIQTIEGEDEYLVFVHPSVDIKPHKKSIKVKKINKTSFISRVVWDSYGLNKYLKKNKIAAKVIISLQNTSIKTSLPCKQIIYLHNVIPFVNYKWDFFKKSEINLLLYRYIYSFFIFLHASKETHFIVQSEWFKAILIEKGIECDKILVAYPEVKITNAENIPLVEMKSNTLSAFYPATSHGYKNHVEIINAFIYMKQHDMDYKDITVYFTIGLNESPELSTLIVDNGLSEHFVFLGPLSLYGVFSYYKTVNLILFPSQLETFGLPLVEAAAMGKPIVAIDLIYAREALQKYEGVSFCKGNDSKSWAENIQLEIKKSSAEPLVMARNGWLEVHKLIFECKEH